MTEAFAFTWLRWYNSADGSKVACVTGRYEDIPHGARLTSEFHASGRPPHPEHGQFQWGIACSRTARVITADIDTASEWADSETGRVTGDWELAATSVRQTPEGLYKAHLVIVVLDESLLSLWPRQGPTAWGDVKSKGFSYIEGTHASGTRYAATGRAPVVATAALMRALAADGNGLDGDDRACSGELADFTDVTATWGTAGYSDEEYAQVTGPLWAQGRRNSVLVAVMHRLLSFAEQCPEGAMAVYERIVADVGADPRYSGTAETDARRALEAAAASHLPRAEWEHVTERRWIAGMFGDESASKIVAREEQRARAISYLALLSAGESGAHVAHGVPDLSATELPLAVRLFPHGEKVEPDGSSDKALARQLLRAAVPSYRYALDAATFYVNQGTHWAPHPVKGDALARSMADAFGDALASAEDVQERVSQEMKDAGAEGPDAMSAWDSETERREKRRAQAAAKLTSSAGQSAVASALMNQVRAGAGGATFTLGAIDAEPHVLWAGGVPWDLLRSGERLAPCEPGVNPVHSKTAACLPQDGPSPFFDALLAAVWPDPETRAWAVREIAGAALWGATSKQHPALDGLPNSGKSTIAEIIHRALGSYAVKLDANKILGGRSDAASEEERAAMIGVRMVWLDEPPVRSRQSISDFNDYASGVGQVSAARKYENRVTGVKAFNFLICQNPRNRLDLSAQGVAERLVIIPCEATGAVVADACARCLPGVERELPCVLARLIRECAAFHGGRRLPRPLSAQMYLDEARAETDEFAAWLFENFEVRPEDAALTTFMMPTVDRLRVAYNTEHAVPNKVPGGTLSRGDVRGMLATLKVPVVREATGARRHNVVLVVRRSLNANIDNSY